MSDSLMTAEQLVLRYKGLSQPALNDVSLTIHRGITLGIVGESGSGKSSLARCLLGLESLESGRIMYEGRDIATHSHAQWRHFRRKVQMVFQDPYNSLNPRLTIGKCLAEVLRVHRVVPESEMMNRVDMLLNSVGLSMAMFNRYPHELSGGQRQRVGIARALSLGPDVIIADEPVSALDVSVQAQILNLLKKLVDETGITLILIAHDLAVVRYICREVVVMKEGVVVETGSAENVIDRPQHPYTKTLLAAVPDIDRVPG